MRKFNIEIFLCTLFDTASYAAPFFPLIGYKVEANNTKRPRHYIQYISPIMRHHWLKGVWHEIFDFRFFSWISVPQASKYSIGAILNFFENSRRYSRINVYHRCQRHRLFGTWLGTIRITWGNPQSGCSDICSYSKRATVGVHATYATRWNSGMKRVKCGWTQPLFHKVSNHRFSGPNLKG